MKNTLKMAVILSALAISSQAISQTSMELEEACYMDVGLTDYIVEVIESGSSGIANVVTRDEAAQIDAILAEEKNAALSVSEKLKAVLSACSEGRILQIKNSAFIDAP